jgi:hypothetical protein
MTAARRIRLIGNSTGSRSVSLPLISTIATRDPSRATASPLGHAGLPGLEVEPRGNVTALLVKGSQAMTDEHGEQGVSDAERCLVRGGYERGTRVLRDERRCYLRGAFGGHPYRHVLASAVSLHRTRLSAGRGFWLPGRAIGSRQVLSLRGVVNGVVRRIDTGFSASAWDMCSR